MNPLDSRQIASRVFHVRKSSQKAPKGAKDFIIDVNGASIGARLYQVNPAFRTVLFFHGNGEIVPDYDDISELFASVQLNLFVVDYRGYGFSTGEPTLRSLTEDPPVIADFFLTKVLTSNSPKPIVMGRSLGSSPATDIALKYGDRFYGLVLESGFANVVPLLDLLGVSLDEKTQIEADHLFSNNRKLRSIKIPVLILHGANDYLIPVDHAKSNFASVSGRKEIRIFEGAGHNDLLARNPNEYFASLGTFAK